MFGKRKQQFMSNTVLSDIYTYSLKRAPKMKQLAHVSLQDFIQPHSFACLIFISERELTFPFAICHIARPSVCRLYVVCNVGAPYSDD